MNIIIPLGGKGERFAKIGYTTPKPLIPIFEKNMIEYLIDNLCIADNDKVFIIYNKNLDNYDFSKYLNDKYPFVNLIKINDTKGAAETLFLGIELIIKKYNYNKKCLILDCDTFYTEDIRNIFNNSNENMVFYTKNYDETPIYSYIEFNEKCIITNIKEKEKISDNANTGAYAFVDIIILHNYCKYVLDNNITYNNEPYTSCVISQMILNNSVFNSYELKEDYVFSLGTPTAVEKFIDNRYAFLFDLDGTLVITDEIYFDVWYEILIKYNIVLTKEIFTTYIQGNNDKYVSSQLLPNLNISLAELSELKDELFIKNIDKVKAIDGIYDIINEIKLLGHKICIVTNCNERVANEIVKYINIDRLIDFIISSKNCINGKPSTEPYKRAIQRYNIDNYKCIIFEDSKSGLLSGKGVIPRLLVGVETIYNENELIRFGANLSIKNYCNLNVNELLSVNMNNSINYLKDIIIKNSELFNIKDILIEDKLKGGFIADVISFKIITKNNIYSQILKYENNQENNLSIMAKKLQLYQREYYFYTNISNKVNINVPKFYNLLINEKNDTIGIVLENLFEKKYEINLNLNNESIDVSLKIVDRIALMHSNFWNKNLKQMFPNLKNSNDIIFCPFLKCFIEDRYEIFKNKWCKILNACHLELCDKIYKNFDKIQERFCNNNNLTFIHGDIKSPNIFYDTLNDNEPYFIDWQHCAIGKGCQDLVFFIIESFDLANIKLSFDLLKQYYYKKLLEYGVNSYSIEEYETDLYYSICYIPFFTSIWFGTTSHDELIDKNFPYFFINKLFYLLEYISFNQNIQF